MEFYRNTLAQIQKNPLLGTVNGSFPVVYSQQAKDTGRVASKNPHNEFMLITVQTGLVGLAALLWLFSGSSGATPRNCQHHWNAASPRAW